MQASWLERVFSFIVVPARKLEPVALPAVDDDPVLAAFLGAPLSEEPETEGEREADMAAIAEYRAGRSRVIDPTEMRALLDRVREQTG